MASAKSLYRHYDVTRDDPFFKSLLGEYHDESPPMHPWTLVPDVGSSPAVLSETACLPETVNKLTTADAAHCDGVSSTFFTDKLHELCLNLYGNTPHFALLSQDQENGTFLYKTSVSFPSNRHVSALGSGHSLQCSYEAAAKNAFGIAKRRVLSAHEYAELTRQFTMSFRTAALRLPFAVRFQLERALLTHGDQLRTKSRRRDTAYSIAIAARKMILVFVQIVLPPLLELDLRGTTLSELFADEIWSSLVRVKNAVEKGNDFSFWEQAVQEASLSATRCLSEAEKVCGVTESELDVQHYDFAIVQKRSMWPIGEYRCQIRASAWPVEDTKDGKLERVEVFDGAQTRLVPTSFEVVNKNRRSDVFVPPCTRRAQREMGWSVRDRFVLISSLKFNAVYNSELSDWLGAEPELCGRRYAYLFDKGTGRPNVWLYSQPTSGDSLLSRENFLACLGRFGDVSPTKLGDRIGLAFTQTIPIAHLSIDNILPFEEIVHNGYVFSDGCGVVGLDIAIKAKEAFHLDSIPGAIQIRIGGVKGMLSLKTDFPSNCIGLRPSMVKYASNHRVLEVKAVPSTNEQQDYNLFNQILIIMGSRMPNRVFLELQTMACAKMAAAEYDKPALEQVVNGNDVAEAYSYVRKVIRQGKKLNGKLFADQELAAIRNSMTEAKKRANLPRIKAALMFAVIDEHNFLAEGEVLVSNGALQGPVLICRSPCNFAGDIQRAYAVPGLKREPFIHFKNVVVFNARGDRPLPDQLAGGDLDGDLYYIIHDERLVGMFEPREPFDFKSRREEPIPRFIDPNESFAPQFSVFPPGIEQQLNVLKNYMKLGNIVPQASDAWLCVADAKGPDDEEAVRMAGVCQRALDARKLSCSVRPEDDYAISSIFHRFGLPDWKGGPRKSNSVIGIMTRNWQKWIDDIETTLNQRNSSTAETNQRKNEPCALVALDDETVASVESQVCVVCLSRDADQECRHCDYVWYCSSDCRRIHDLMLGHSLQPRLLREETHSALDMLIEVTFRRKHHGISSEDAICFDSLTDGCLHKLANLTCTEYLRSLSDEVMRVKNSNARRASVAKPHPFDVVLLESKIYKQGGELVICRPVGETGTLIMVDGAGNTCPVEEAPPGRRVSSLSGVVRILESLMSEPATGSLMRCAMKRENILDIENAVHASIDQTIASGLNERQIKAVSAILGPSFKKGFAAILGPPGTGKTHMITSILKARERGVLVTAPSNAAVANLALSLLETNRFHVRDVVVYGENCDQSVEFLNPTTRRRKYIGFRRSYDQIADEEEKEKKLRDFAAQLFMRGDKASLEEIESLCEFDGEGSPNLLAVASAAFVFCTLNTAGSTSLRKAVVKRRCFDLLVLDEAAQCTEAEFFIATTFPGVKRVVLVGDPKQLSATVIDPKVREAGYGESFLSRLYEFRREFVWLLDVQYRSHPQIIQFSNETFYDSALSTGQNVLNRVPVVKNPVQFINLSGMSEEVRSNTSYLNEYEAAAIKHWIDNDQDILRLVQAARESIRMIVISPYLAQVTYLEQKYLKKFRADKVLVDIATVDSFQGQEGDIVIMSTVRTTPSEFLSDDRINVAMTRAKRILRIFGDLDSFSLASNSLVLQKLARFAKQRNLYVNSKIDAAWRRPDWTVVTNFKPTMTARFYHSLRGMTRIDRNVAFNTLQTVTKPDLKKLSSFPSSSRSPRWFMSSLKGHSSAVQVVWIAKENQSTVGQDYSGIVEGHFAGSREECLQFTQINAQVPKLACGIKCDVKHGFFDIVRPDEGDDVSPQATELALSWLVTNELQEAALDTEMPGLPEGLFLLDPYQEIIVAQKPPLLLESRSGTGKTNCLFSHALSYAQAKMQGVAGTQMPICFVTVSTNLKSELKNMYDEANAVAGQKLWPVNFFSFRGLLDYLIGRTQMKLHTSDVYSYLEYVYTDRTSKKETLEDSTLIENEIGGVITGSLQAAMSRAPLSREQYMNEKRSNVQNDTEEGRNARCRIYDEYELYLAAKMAAGKYDINDIVLRLIGAIGDRTNVLVGTDLFQSAYIDEVQDFSYAALYLVLSVAGSAEGNWAAAGDTAQMITPGCSYTFDGMKQTMRAVNSHVKMEKVKHLTRNYRMSKDVLDVGNALLELLKKHYPQAIEYAPPEVAMKDLGFRVVLLDYEKAKQYTGGKSDAKANKLSFGTRQAMIIATPHDPKEAKIAMKEWIGEHPFILSSLDSKGLEFEDVMVHAFGYRHKAWTIGQSNFDGLRLLRELYVAVTRARRRVVILTNRVKGMDRFFTDLDVNPGMEWIDPSVILNEFEKETTPEMWFKQGMELFNDEKYELSHSCFNAANEFGWASRAQGRHFYGIGRKLEAKTLYRIAANIFSQKSEFGRALDVLIDLAEISPWEKVDDEVLNKALLEEPHYLPRPSTVKFSLLRGAWNTLTVGDLIDGSTSGFFRDYRQTSQLQELLQKCTAHELQSVERTLPAVVGDFYLERERFADAVRLYLLDHESSSAAKATESALRSNAIEVILSVVEYWRRHDDLRRSLSGIDSKKINLLLSLVDSPRKTSLNAASECVKFFGNDVIRLAVINHAECGCEELYRFDRVGFRDEILQELSTRHTENLVDVVAWYLEREETPQAAAFAWNNVEKWSDDQLLAGHLLKVMKKKATRLVRELEKRLLLAEGVKVFLSIDAWDLSLAENVSNEALKTIESSEIYADQLFESWNARRHDTRIKSWMRKSNVTTKIRLLLHLFNDPQHTADLHGKLCYASFGGRIVSNAVNRKTYQGRHLNSILRKFDASLAPEPKQASSQAESQQQGQRPRVGSDSDTSAGAGTYDGKGVVGGKASSKTDRTFPGELTSSESEVPPLWKGAQNSSSESDVQSLDGFGSEVRPPLSIPTPDQFSIGDRVIVQHLQSKKQYNDCHGTIKSKLIKTGRFCVRMDVSGSELSVRPECLRLETAGNHASNQSISGSSEDDEMPFLEPRGQNLGSSSSSDESPGPGLADREVSDDGSSTSTSSDEISPAHQGLMNNRPLGRRKWRAARKVD